MKIRMLLAALVVVAIAGFVAAPGYTEEPEAPPAGNEMHDAWMKMGQPGEHHEWMKFLVGTWKGAVKYWEPGSTTPMEFEGKMVSTWILNNRYIRSKWSSEMQGQPFNGEATLAYNNGAKRVESTWIDSASTAMAFDTGPREGDTIKLTGKLHSPMGAFDTRSETTKISNDEYKMTSWWNIPGMGEMKVMELHYTRVVEK